MSDAGGLFLLVTKAGGSVVRPAVCGRWAIEAARNAQVVQRVEAPLYSRDRQSGVLRQFEEQSIGYVYSSVDNNDASRQRTHKIRAASECFEVQDGVKLWYAHQGWTVGL